jgi:pimeloyl-ACP methyl ester carboxylesterase
MYHIHPQEPTIKFFHKGASESAVLRSNWFIMGNQTSTCQKMQLKDGRTLGYAEYGCPKGKPLFYFHGFPGSRLEGDLLAEAAARLEVRLISFDRPGMGLSSFQPDRQVLNIADDVIELADHLQINRFAVMGLSGGAAYVSACAYKIAPRLDAATIISGLGPMNQINNTRGMIFTSRVTLWLGIKAPWFEIALFGIMAKYLSYTRDLSFFRQLPKPDQIVFRSPQFKEKYCASLLEAFRFGARGVAWDARILARPWNFDLEYINFPIHLWHGELDRNVPLGIGKQVANKVYNCQPRYLKNEGHFSLPLNHMDEIIASSVL